MQLPIELERHVDLPALEANARNYAEMHADVSSRDEREITAIRNRILGIPLLHATVAPEQVKLDSIAERGLLSAQQMGAEARNTFPIDHDLGLDNFVFMNWGVLDIWYGEKQVVVDAEIMLDDTVVTPEDITRSSLTESIKDKRYDELSAQERERLNDTYFSKMVTGDSWLEIVSRRIHAFAKENPQYPYPLSRYDTLGEIKRLDIVPPKAIQDVLIMGGNLSDQNLVRSQWNNRVLAQGISLGSTVNTLKLEEEIKQHYPDQLRKFKAGGWTETVEAS